MQRGRNGVAIVATVIAILAIATRASGSADGGGGHSILGGILGVDDVDRPPPSPESQPEPLGTPAAPPAGGGPHEFLRTHDGRPVAYDPCRPIHVVVNNRMAPFGADEVVDFALEAAGRATGLQFVVDGPTDEPPRENRPPYQPDRYADRWAPVLIAWSDPAEHPMLDGDIAGLGGSTAIDTGDGPVYVTGEVILDGPALAPFLDSGRGIEEVAAVVLHELGHLLGLDHVDDHSQIMFDQGVGPLLGVVGYSAGDREGLAALGRGRCAPDL